MNDKRALSNYEAITIILPSYNLPQKPIIYSLYDNLKMIVHTK